MVEVIEVPICACCRRAVEEQETLACEWCEAPCCPDCIEEVGDGGMMVCRTCRREMEVDTA